VVFRELALFPNIDQHEFVPAIETTLDFIYGGFFHARPRLVHDFEKAWCVLHGKLLAIA
jgi:hypothetical protein